jgi:type I restriction-modification system DNA methylase subunit
MDITTIENWLWEAACNIRGPLDAPKYKDYILPLLFYKRLSDVYEDELARLGEEFGDESLARHLAQEDRALIRFYIPNGYTWPEVYENDAFHRFMRGTPPSSSADWGWIQHMYASLNVGGKMAVVLDTGAVSRGSGNQGSNKERDLRRTFVEGDLVTQRPTRHWMQC